MSAREDRAGLRERLDRMVQPMTPLGSDYPVTAIAYTDVLSVLAVVRSEPGQVSAEQVAAAVRPVADAISVNECRKFEDGHQHPANECPAAKAAIAATLATLGIAVTDTTDGGAS